MTVATMADPAEVNWRFLQDELFRLRLLLRRYVRAQAPGDAVDGLDDSSYAADALGTAREMDALATRPDAPADEFDLPLRRLATDFALTPFEVQGLNLALAVELDASFGMLLARCQPETGYRRPTVALALRLFCTTAAEWTAGRQAFAAGSTLRSFALVHLEQLGETLLTSPYHLDERVAGFLLGMREPPEAIAPLIKIVQPPRPELVPRSEAATRLGNVLRRAFTDDASARVIVNLHGQRGAGRRTLAALATAEFGVPLVAVSAALLMPDNLVPLFFREAVLMRSAAYLDCADLPEDAMRTLVRACASSGPLVFLGTAERAGWIDPPPNTTVLTLGVPAPTPAERRSLWQAQLEAPLDAQADALATRFAFTPGDVAAVLSTARTDALLRTPADPRVTAADIWQAARRHPQHRLAEMARRIEPRANWDDIVLPATARAQLLEIEQQVALQTRVYETWGFGPKMTRGRGVSALFSGPSGTGKTMAAEVLAGALDLDLFRIDLSCVVSKYIGETEKNLARVFDEAERSGAILFFDEADALFGKRSEVKDAHDRYANIEVNYLLQRMEEFQGLAILATNMRQALDEAFLRRLRFLVEFTLPDAPLRAGIWRRVFPAEVPRDDLDIDFLARQFRISGGNIRNIALHAAFLAAADEVPLGMVHLIRAAKREFDKIGKTCLESDFGAYFGLVRQEG